MTEARAGVETEITVTKFSLRDDAAECDSDGDIGSDRHEVEVNNDFDGVMMMSFKVK